jgi:hypothetical protein
VLLSPRVGVGELIVLAVTDRLVNTVGVYALIVGVFVATAAILIRYGGQRVVVPSHARPWTTR